MKPHSLAHDLATWDGRKVADLQPLASGLPQNRQTLSLLLELARDAAAPAEAASTKATSTTPEAAASRMEIAATWLFKHLVEQGALRDDASTNRTALGAELVACLAAVHDDNARLHLLQCLSDVALKARVAPALAKTLQRLEASENKFVRAWTMDALGHLGALDASRAASIRKKLERALAAESPAVCVRVRHALKRLADVD